MAFVLALDQSTTSSRAMVFDAERRLVGEASLEIRCQFPRSRLGRAGPGGALVDERCRHPRCRGEFRGRGFADRGHGHHQPARDGRCLGPCHRQRGFQRHRLAGPEDRGPVPAPRRRGSRSDDRRAHGPAGRCLLLGYEDCLDSRSRRRRPHKSPTRRIAGRHGRLFSSVAHDPGGRSCHRRHQRFEDDALQYPRGTLGRGSLPSPRSSPVHASRGKGQRRRFWHSVAHRNRHFRSRRGRRPAGRSHRPGLLPAGA